MPSSRRPPGRPRIDPDNPSFPVHVGLSVKQYDEIFQRARQARQSLADFIRRQLREPERQPRR
jgi:hypothetical protein